MEPIISYRYGDLRLQSAVPLAAKEIERLVGMMLRSPANQDNGLGGRVAVSRITLPEIGPAVLKYYRRGGLIRRMLKDRYLYDIRRRCRKEFDMLAGVRSLGVTAPRPLVAAFSSGLFYFCWLITEAIDSSGSLADLSHSDPVAAKRCTRQAAEQIRILIGHRILHVDLHPGNVLVGTDGRVHLVDFDRARRYRLAGSSLCSRYRRRWQRAVVKHDLPGFLVDELDAGLADQAHPK
ncbi:MAG TPA: lipopolysaccharide kinase InaA family protein [Desulfobacterales bacterium]